VTHDRAGPTDLSEAARLAPNTPQFDELRGWIDSQHPGPISILDVGGGGGFYDFPAALRARARRMVGVDPDAGVLTRPWLDEGHQALVEDFAPTTDERFEVALCVYVIEHVEAPGPFLEAVRSLLAPGGSCFGVTPNLWHYFGLASAGAARAGIQEWLLGRLRPPGLIEAYHSPVRYRCNTIARLRATALDAGFRGAEFRVLEQSGMFETYFPTWLRWAPRTYSRFVNVAARPALFGTIMFRLVS
jgi:SAM-dependent methyltransferase